VVRDHDAVAADRNRALGVVDALDAFQEQLAGPEAAQLLDVFPVEARVHLAPDRGDDVDA